MRPDLTRHLTKRHGAGRGRRNAGLRYATGTARPQEDLAKTLDDAPPDEIATVDEQRAFGEARRAEQGRQ
jgi:hypothetical protein